MHVAVDAHNLLADRRGIGTYLRAVLRRMLKTGGCKLTLLVRHPLPTLQKRALARELEFCDFAVASRIPRDVSVAWHPWNGTFFLGARRNVVTMHDVAPFAFPAADTGKQRSQREPFELSARTADRIIADSRFSKDEIERYLHVEPERVTVVPLAAGEIFSPGAPQQLPEVLQGRRYILYVGTFEERKNVQTLIDAWRRSIAPLNVELAIVSGDDVPGDVIALQNVSPERFRDVYRAAVCLAFPTLYEGFGLPALEAMACGAPVVVSRVASLPEICGNAACYVDEPQSVAAWESALRAVVSSEAMRADLSQRGISQARKFSWDSAAHATMQILADVAS